MDNPYRRVCPKCNKQMEYLGCGKWMCWKPCENVIKEKVICERCEIREATLRYCGGTMGGGSADICEVCNIEDELKVARMWASKIEKLEEKLKKVKNEN